MKRVVLLLLCMLPACFWASAQGRVEVPERVSGRYPCLYAHRGVWTKDSSKVFIIPENSIAAVEQAARLGFDGVEVDVKYTKDRKLVIMHDSKLNRTVRVRDGYKKLSEPIKPEDLTLKELRRDYVLASSDPSQRKPVPTLKEVLKTCKKLGLKPMLHSALPESYKMAQRIMGDNWICFTSRLEMCVAARKISDCMILYSINKGTPEVVVEILDKIGGPCGISSMKYELYTSDFVCELTENGYQVQASIFPLDQEIKAIEAGVTFILTDHLCPRKK